MRKAVDAAAFIMGMGVLLVLVVVVVAWAVP